MVAQFDNYRSSVPGIIWPPLLEGTAALLQSYLAKLEESQWLPVSTIETRQFAQLGLLAEHCMQHSPAFAVRLAEAGLSPGDLAQPAGLQRLPPLLAAPSNKLLGCSAIKYPRPTSQ